MSAHMSRKVVPAQLGFLAIYNPSLGTTDDTVQDQIVYYASPSSSAGSHHQAGGDRKAEEDARHEQNNEQLRQIGLAQGMVEFGRSFSDGKAVDTVETEKSRIVLHELEAGWWIIASISLTILPNSTDATSAKGKGTEQPEPVEYSSREVKPAILLLGDLLRAHSTFLLHHASSLSALFVRTRRSKFVSIIGRYWNTFISSWNVLMHGNPANNLYGGIKIAACGELGMGVGEEDRGSGEREVLEGFAGRTEGLVDVIVSKFGDYGGSPGRPSEEKKRVSSENYRASKRWLGSGNEPAAEDGVIFLGTGALSPKSLCNVSHWIEDVYRWGPYAYGVNDNPTSNRRGKREKHKQSTGKGNLKSKGPPASEAVEKARQVYGLDNQDSKQKQGASPEGTGASMPPLPVHSGHRREESQSSKSRPSLDRGPASYSSSDNDLNKGNKFIQYLKLGYGTHWSLGGTTAKGEAEHTSSATPSTSAANGISEQLLTDTAVPVTAPVPPKKSEVPNDSAGHFLIGLVGDIETEDDDISQVDPKDLKYKTSAEDGNARVLVRTLTVELEREEDARAEAEISIDLGNNDQEKSSSKHTASEHTTSNASFESQDRNKTKKVRVVVYAKRPFIFVFLYALRTDALALNSLYRSLHYDIGPLFKPLLASTAYRASKPEAAPEDASTTPIYDLVWDPKLLTIHSSIPNIPDPLQSHFPDSAPPIWSRVEALNTHMQIINTYIASGAEKSELERTSKTSRGWWVVWTRIPDPDPPEITLASGPVRIPGLITETSVDSQTTGPIHPVDVSRGTSTFNPSMNSGPAHPFLDSRTNAYEQISKDKEIFLIRRASDNVKSRSGGIFTSGSSPNEPESWTSGPSKLAQGIGVDTKRYIDALLNLNR